MKPKALLVRLALSAASAAAFGIVATVVIAVVELYLTGHGYGSLMRELITWAPGGVHI